MRHVPAQQARAESDNPVLFLESRGNDASCFGRCIDFNLNFPLPRLQPGRNKTLTCALVAEQSRTSPASSGSTAALDRMAEGLQKSSKRREGRNDKENEESVAAVQPTVQCFLSKLPSSFSFSAPFLFPRPLSSANLGDDLASSRNSTPEMEEKTKRTTKVWRRCSQLFNLLFRNLLFFCGPCLFPLPSSSANLGDYLASSRYSTPVPWPLP